MRVLVIGSGLAGSLLAWRLVQHADVGGVDLVTRAPGLPDATAVSGGVVRGFDPDPFQRRLSVDSLVELRSDPMLRQWAELRTRGFLYVADPAPSWAGGAAEVDAAIHGSVSLPDVADLADAGWAGLPDTAGGLYERQAGWVNPDALRRRVLADFAARRMATVVEGPATVPHNASSYDVVVVAAGAWTPALLRSAGLPAGGLRTKAIQYAVHATTGWRPTPFLDATTGLYGRPVGRRDLLVGLPTSRWDVVPVDASVDPGLNARGARLASARFPLLRLRGSPRGACAVDCYHEQPHLRLRPVAGVDHLLFTFTGGSGGAAKTALAATARATSLLVTASGADPQPQPEPTFGALS
jgi:glycine/D-amino acid oxidase-like deaminating enzyme